jgi:APA family basic amino acid/polyamine antiporter
VAPNQDLPTSPASSESPTLARRLGLFDITMLVMGSVIGAGIFVVPHDVAQLVHTPALILIAWVVGGAISVAGSLVYADLSRRRPVVGGQYAFLREAYHPIVGFLYGWCLLWVIQSGGIASVAVVFARYVLQFGYLFSTQDTASLAQATDATTVSVIAAAAIAGLTALNCLGVRTGSTAQNIFMALKILAIGTLIVVGLLVAQPFIEPVGGDAPVSVGGWEVMAALAAALVPVLFSYGGWHTTTFIAEEVTNVRRNLPLGLVLGVIGVAVLYLGVNFACVRVLGAGGLVASGSPASDVMRQAMGAPGNAFISAGIAISAIGFLSQAILLSPRVYYAMASDGLFFRSIARIHPRTRVPVNAVLLQGAVAIVIAVSGTFHQIVNYVMSVELTFMALTAMSLFIFRRRDAAAGTARGQGVPGHPATTLLFTAAVVAIVLAMFWQNPVNSTIGFGIAAVGIPAYASWRWRERGQDASPLGPAQ